MLRSVSMAWLLGAGGTAAGLGFVWPVVFAAGIGTGLALLRLERQRDALLVGVLVACVLLGGARYESAQPFLAPDGVVQFNGSGPVHLAGVVDSEPELDSGRQRFVMSVAGVKRGREWVEADGRVLVTARPFPERQYGEIVEVRTSLETPPSFEGFDYREYLARQDIGSTALYPEISVLGDGGGDWLRKALIDARTPMRRGLEQALPEPESGLARGILLGQRSSIPDDLNVAFNDAGISHLIAISGYNVMLVAGAVTGACTPITGRRNAVVIAMAAVAIYTLFVGSEPPVLRAMIMALVTLGAIIAGRPGSALTGLLLAGALMVAWQPAVVDDVSFQLSFGATLGIVVLERPLHDQLIARLWSYAPGGIAVFLATQIAVTTSATIAASPIIALTFGRVSLVSLPANIAASLLFSAAFAGSLVTAAAGAVDPRMGSTVGEFTYWPLHGLVMIAELASSVPLAAFSVGEAGIALSVVIVVAPLLVIGLGRRVDLLLEHQIEAAPVRPAAVLAIGAVLAAVVVWWGTLETDSSRLRVAVLDVGQGDSILIETPDGRRVLVDGGPDGDHLMQSLGEALPSDERRIDLMVLTHGQDDHVTGLVEVLERLEVGAVVWNGVPNQTAAFREWEARVLEMEIPLKRAVAGERVDLGSGVLLEVLHPSEQFLSGTEDDQNNNSVVLRLNYGEISFLLTGDIEADAEEAILNAGHNISATVLKVSHHGSDGATTPAFLEAVSPSFAVISAGEGNPFGHPSPALRLRLANFAVLRTDVHGMVQFSTDGARLWLDAERGDVVVPGPVASR